MDERKLGELFRDAVPDVPSPSFGYQDIAAEANLARVRRRNALLGGSVLGVAILAGATVLGVALWKGTETAGDATSTSAGPYVAGGSGNGEAVPNEVPNEDAQRSQSSPESGASDRSFSAESPKQGGTPTGNAGPPAGSTPSGCEKADLELAAALAGELQAAVSISDAVPADIGCPPSSRGVAFRVSGGIISVIVAPNDAELSNPVAGQPEGSLERDALAADGRHVIVVSEPEIGSTEAPLEADLDDIVRRVAGKV